MKDFDVKTALNRRKFLKLAGTAATGAAISADNSRAAESAPATLHRQLPVLDSVDVLVVGGGPAGIGAALGAARKGSKTLLIENHAFFGGVGAWCLGMPINQVRPNGKPRSAIHELLIQKLQALGNQAVRIGSHQLWCNVDYLKVAVLDALDQARCRYLVAVRAVDTLVKNNRVTGVVVTTKEGLVLINADSVVDCTGDADVAFYAGAETMKEAGQLSPMTLCLNLTNITKAQLRKVTVSDVVAKARPKYPLIPRSWGLGIVGNSNTSFYINHAGTKELGQFDATDPAQRTQAEALSRRQAVQMVQAMREFGGDDLKDIELLGTGPQLGVRETRRIKGAYVLNEEDAKAGRKFDDAIAWRSGFLDIGFVRMDKMKIHDVPYRSLLPEKLDGLLVAGRCISATHVAASAGKSMGNCMATGHAAGLAASLAARKKCMPRELKVKELQDALRADQVDLDMTERDQVGLGNEG